VTFEEARAVFDDPLHLSLLDRRFSYFEERWVSIGMAGEQKVGYQTLVNAALRDYVHEHSVERSAT
jgi:uncharacterized DUF497 family protein